MASPIVAEGEHPRLFFDPEALAALRGAREHGFHGRMWQNLLNSAEWCLGQKPRRGWIAPKALDPIYENLYDRFYGMMRDTAILEHLAFTGAIGEDESHCEAARRWLLSTTRAWAPEAREEPNASKAYAVSRLMKGISVGYDIIKDYLSDSEASMVRDFITKLASSYYYGYFSTPPARDWSGAAHHHIVEWGSFGVTALAFLGEVAGADEWLEATTTKFLEQLLPKGLTREGAQAEGATFWASTMQYRIFYMDALRRVTGRDLLTGGEEYMSVEPALAAVATGKDRPGYNLANGTVLLQPSYGQLDYISPVLFFIAREYRRSVCQRLAKWDNSAGSLQRTRYITPHGEELIFHLGGYAYTWYDDSVPAEPIREPLGRHFSSIGEAYLRTGWDPGELVVGARENVVGVHGAGKFLLIAEETPPSDLKVVEMRDGAESWIRMESWRGSMVITLRRPDSVTIERNLDGDWSFRCQETPRISGNVLRWEDATAELRAGVMSRWDPEGYSPVKGVGMGRLRLKDPFPQTFTQISLRPSQAGVINLELTISRAR